jgi:hypothetical protein
MVLLLQRKKHGFFAWFVRMTKGRKPVAVVAAILAVLGWEISANLPVFEDN